MDKIYCSTKYADARRNSTCRSQTRVLPEGSQPESSSLASDIQVANTEGRSGWDSGFDTRLRQGDNLKCLCGGRCLTLKTLDLIVELLKKQYPMQHFDVPTEVEKLGLKVLDDGDHVALLRVQMTAINQYFVKVYNSAPRKLSPDDQKLILSWLPPNSEVSLEHVPIQSQRNDYDCVVFVIMCMTHICHGLDHELATIVFDDSAIRSHLKYCLERQVLTEFPSVEDENQQKLHVERMKLPAQFFSNAHTS